MNHNANPLPHKKFPSCLSVQNLGFQSENDVEDDNCDDWTEGWGISTPPPLGTKGPLKKRNNGHYSRVPTPEIPFITESHFRYYPKDNAMVGRDKRGEVEEKDGDDGSLRLARRRLAKKSREGDGRGLVKWLRELLAKIRKGREH